MKMRAWLMLVALGGLAGCSHLTYTTGKHRGGGYVEETNHFFLGGLVNVEEVVVPDHCPNGASKVHVYQTFGDGFVSGITLGIYTPRTVEIWCAAESHAQVSNPADAVMGAKETLQ